MFSRLENYFNHNISSKQAKGAADFILKIFLEIRLSEFSRIQPVFSNPGMRLWRTKQGQAG